MDDKLPLSSDSNVGQTTPDLPPPKIYHSVGQENHTPAPPYDPMHTPPHHSNENIPDPIHITQTNKYSEKNDPPLVDVKVTNPVTYLKEWLKRLLKNEGLDLRIKIRPLTFVAFALALTASFGTGFNVARVFFPNSSPILHREVSYQGTVQKTENGVFFLSLADNSLYKLTTKSPNALNTLESSVNKQALIKGNLGAEAGAIDVKEATSFSAPVLPPPPITPPPQNPSLPTLFEGLTWESTQKRTLVFTSGKRRVEQEGVYLESVILPEYPQDFINYYLKNLVSLGFTETLNVTDTEGTTLSFEKTGLYLTYGVKYIYSGSGDKKKLTGYKAFVEHN